MGRILLQMTSVSEMLPTSSLGSDISLFIIFHVRFSSLQLYSRTNHRFFHPPQKCHTIVAFVTNQFNSIIAEQFLTSDKRLEFPWPVTERWVISFSCNIAPFFGKSSKVGNVYSDLEALELLNHLFQCKWSSQLFKSFIYHDSMQIQNP